MYIAKDSRMVIHARTAPCDHCCTTPVLRILTLEEVHQRHRFCVGAGYALFRERDGWCVGYCEHPICQCGNTESPMGRSLLLFCLWHPQLMIVKVPVVEYREHIDRTTVHFLHKILGILTLLSPTKIGVLWRNVIQDYQHPVALQPHALLMLDAELISYPGRSLEGITSRRRSFPMFAVFVQL